MHDLGQLIDATHRQVAVAALTALTAPAALTALYWQLGHRVRMEDLEGRRTESGAQIVAAVRRQLEVRHGRSFGEKSLRHMLRFGQAFSTWELSPRCGDDCRSHFKQLVLGTGPGADIAIPAPPAKPRGSRGAAMSAKERRDLIDEDRRGARAGAGARFAEYAVTLEKAHRLALAHVRLSPASFCAAVG